MLRRPGRSPLWCPTALARSSGPLVFERRIDRGVLTPRLPPFTNRSACQHATRGGGTSVATTAGRGRASASGRQHLTASEAEVFAVAGRHPDLLDPAPPTVIPQPPPLPVEDRVR